jgi:ADP-ribose pyrophosphatase YjhB (NUDIX family)
MQDHIGTIPARQAQKRAPGLHFLPARPKMCGRSPQPDRGRQRAAGEIAEIAMSNPWLDHARRIEAIAQIGLTYSQTPYDTERYEELRRIAAAIMARGDAAHEARLLDLFAREEGYATPKVDVRAAAFDSAGRVLMVRERADGRWTLPGGWADVGESAARCVEREMREEAGFEGRAVQLLAVYDRALHPHEPELPFHVYKMFFLCRLTGGQARASHETSEVGFFERGSLPELSIGRVTAPQVERMFEHLAHPEWPTDFD